MVITSKGLCVSDKENAMAESSSSTPAALINFVGEVFGILPNITPDLLEKLLEYLSSAGVRSEADIEKVHEHELSLIFGPDDAKKLLGYYKNRVKAMVENAVSAKEAVMNFAVQVHGVLPSIVPDVLEKLLEFLLSAGLRSEADIEKLDEHQLAAIIGDVDAKRLLCYLKKQQPEEVETYSFPSTIGSLVAGMPESEAAVPSSGENLGGTIDLLKMIMMMQKMEADKNREIIMAVTAMQDKTLNAVMKQVSDVTTMHKDTLDKMSEQMTKQSKMHQQTVEVMSEQMKTAARMHGETLKTVQQGMAEAQKMNTTTLNEVTKNITGALEAQEKNMQEFTRILATRRDNCVIL